MTDATRDKLRADSDRRRAEWRERRLYGDRLREREFTATAPARGKAHDGGARFETRKDTNDNEQDV